MKNSKEMLICKMQSLMVYLLNFCCFVVNVGAIVPLVAVPVGAFALGGLGFAMWRKKM